MTKFWQGRSYIQGGYGQPAGTAQIALNILKSEVEEMTEKVEKFMKEDWSEFEEKAKNWT